MIFDDFIQSGGLHEETKALTFKIESWLNVDMDFISNTLREVYEQGIRDTRERIAQEIEAIHPDTSWTYDADIVKVVEAAAAIARGKN